MFCGRAAAGVLSLLKRRLASSRAAREAGSRFVARSKRSPDQRSGDVDAGCGIPVRAGAAFRACLRLDLTSTVNGRVWRFIGVLAVGRRGKRVSLTVSRGYHPVQSEAVMGIYA